MEGALWLGFIPHPLPHTLQGGMQRSIPCICDLCLQIAESINLSTRTNVRVRVRVIGRVTVTPIIITGAGARIIVLFRDAF